MSSTINPPTARSVASSVQPAHPESVAATIPRRHDLDALRAIAMLLGIALHGALSFFPMPDAGWSIHDVRQSSVFGLFTALIHGFRMPLFFLISGFFTAMLWRKRGLRALLKQRFKRVFLPLMIGMVTIIPAVWVVIIGTAIYQAQSPGTQGEENIWTAARSGNLEVIQSEIAAGAPLNQRDPIFGATPLALATWQGNTGIMEALISGGAEVNARNRDGATPLHGAALLGRSEAFDMLISHGGSLAERDRAGSTPTDRLNASWGRTMIVVGFMGAVVDQDSLFEGRKAIARRLESERSDPAVEATAAPIVAANEISKIDGQQQMAGLSIGLVLLEFFPLFHHLWFLWFLCWLVGAFAIYALVSERFSWKMPSWLVISPLRYAWLIPLTLIPQAMMGLIGPSFGPDTSTGLLPMPQILLYYAIFFFFGALYFDSDDREARLGRRWYLTLPLALLIIFPLGLEMTTGEWGFSDGWLNSKFYHPVAVLLPVVYVWLMTFGLMGAFRRVYSDESKVMRYVSDSSYWLYLVHLPLIMIVQAAVRTWELPVFIKFALVCTVTTAILLASYQLFVRYTPIGTLLNGPRHRPHKITDAVLVAATSPTD